MTVDHPSRVVLDSSQPDEPTPFQSHRITRERKSLHREVKRWRGILQKNALPAPVAEKRTSTCVNVFSWMIPSFTFSQDNAHQVMRTGRIVTFLHLGSNLVVRLSDYLRQGNSRLIVKQG